jgi:hypothetical protein
MLSDIGFSRTDSGKSQSYSREKVNQFFGKKKNSTLGKHKTIGNDLAWLAGVRAAFGGTLARAGALGYALPPTERTVDKSPPP